MEKARSIEREVRPRWRVAGIPVRGSELVWVLDEVGRAITPEVENGLGHRLVIVSPDEWVPTAAHFSGQPLPPRAWSGHGLVAVEAPATCVEASHRRAALARFPHLSPRARQVAEPSPPASGQVRLKLEVQITDSAVVRAVSALSQAVRARGGRALVVGGSVRDALWDVHHGTETTVKNVDIEVYGVTAGELHEIVRSAHPDIEQVGADFGVLKVESLDLDVSLPRRERKAGVGHRGFVIVADPTMTPTEAAARRDFSINAVSWDPLTGEVIDPVGGAADLEAMLLRHAGPQFAEDPLRVLRGAQFVARLGLVVDPATEVLCRSLLSEATDLPRERVWDEIGKLLLRGRWPGAGLWFLERVGWTAVASPQLASLRGVPQDPKWHPEGDVFTHTAHVLDFWSERLRTGDAYEDLLLALAAVAHDFGKATTTELLDGRWRAHAHEEAAREPVRAWLSDAQFPAVDGIRRSELISDVVALIDSHLAPVQLYTAQSGDRAIRRLAQKVGRLDRLVRLAHADHGGRPPLDNREFPAGTWLLERAAALEVTASRPQPLLRGQDLIDHLGWAPGPHFRAVLDTVFEAQLDGTISTRDEALALARVRSVVG